MDYRLPAPHNDLAFAGQSSQWTKDFDLKSLALFVRRESAGRDPQGAPSVPERRTSHMPALKTQSIVGTSCADDVSDQ